MKYVLFYFRYFQVNNSVLFESIDVIDNSVLESSDDDEDEDDNDDDDDDTNTSAFNGNFPKDNIIIPYD